MSMNIAKDPVLKCFCGKIKAYPQEPCACEGWQLAYGLKQCSACKRMFETVYPDRQNPAIVLCFECQTIVAQYQKRILAQQCTGVVKP